MGYKGISKRLKVAVESLLAVGKLAKVPGDGLRTKLAVMR